MMHLRELEEVADFRLTPKQNARVDALLAESDSLTVFRERKNLQDARIAILFRPTRSSTPIGIIAGKETGCLFPVS